ncbi:enoyl-CoA hydratase/carnithine racemase [Rathayibacter agropyri]|nr:enoyl-CoA hydratase/isomerase family protein [Rathayibacter agropyri]
MTIDKSTRPRSSARCRSLSVSEVTGVDEVYHVDGGLPLRVIRLGGGTKRTKGNILDASMLLGLERDLARAFQANAVGLVITGTRGFFSVGADVHSFRVQSASDVGNFIDRGLQVMEQLRTAPIPTVALVNGVALGGGLELALHCDLRVATSTVRAIGFPESGHGFLPSWGGVGLVSQLTSQIVAKEILFDRVTPQTYLTGLDAVAIGLLHLAVPSHILHENAEVLFGLMELAIAYRARRSVGRNGQRDRSGVIDTFGNDGSMADLLDVGPDGLIEFARLHDYGETARRVRSITLQRLLGARRDKDHDKESCSGCRRGCGVASGRNGNCSGGVDADSQRIYNPQCRAFERTR